MFFTSAPCSMMTLHTRNGNTSSRCKVTDMQALLVSHAQGPNQVLFSDQRRHQHFYLPCVHSCSCDCSCCVPLVCLCLIFLVFTLPPCQPRQLVCP